MNSWRSHVATEIAGSAPVIRVAQRRWARMLRTLAYHDVANPERFEAQLRHLADHYHVVSEDDVIAAAAGVEIHDRSVWLTFDDGGPGVVDHALPLLERYGFTATLFVCPAVIDTAVPLWWQILEQADAAGIPVLAGTPRRKASVVTALKSVDDDHRRTTVRSVWAQYVAATGSAPVCRQLTSAELRRWVEAGHRVGNHTWDHPLLDTCDPTEQERQVHLAHRWLTDMIPEGVRSFAYPNGNWSINTERVIEALGYRVGVLFDHRLSRHTQHPLRRSRVRVSSDADLSRFRTLVSGTHPALYHAARRWLT